MKLSTLPDIASDDYYQRPLSTPSQTIISPTLSMHLLNPPSPPTPSIHAFKPSYQPTLSMHLLNPACPPTPSIHTFNTGRMKSQAMITMYVMLITLVTLGYLAAAAVGLIFAGEIVDETFQPTILQTESIACQKSLGCSRCNLPVMIHTNKNQTTLLRCPGKYLPICTHLHLYAPILITIHTHILLLP